MLYLNPELRRALLARVVAIVNGKGGVGKTMIATVVATLLAASGQRVLLVDFDPQGNVDRNLGIRQRGLGDDGLSLAKALQYGEQPRILKDVRPGLDVITGGKFLGEVGGALGVRRERDGQAAAVNVLAALLCEIAQDYDVILIDCPPGERTLQEAALGAARYLVIPTKSDENSLDGLEAVATRVGDVLSVNPDIQPLGVVLYDTQMNAKAIHKSVSDWIDTALGGAVTLFAQKIRHVEAVAKAVTTFGLAPKELTRGPEVGVPKSVAKAAAGLSEDFDGLSVEILDRLIAAELAAATAEQTAEAIGELV